MSRKKSAELILDGVLVSLALSAVKKKCNPASKEVLETLALGVAMQTRKVLENDEEQNSDIQEIIDGNCLLIMKFTDNFNSTYNGLITTESLIQKNSNSMDAVKPNNKKKNIWAPQELEYVRKAKKSITALPHNIETVHIIGTFYNQYLVPDEAFTHLPYDSQTSINPAIEAFSHGGLLDRFTPTERELQFHSQYKRNILQSETEYESPENLYTKYIIPCRQNNDTCAAVENGDILVLSTPDKQNMCVARLPPKEPGRKAEYGSVMRKSLEDCDWVTEAQPDYMVELYPKLMEISLLCCRNRGMSSLLLYKILEHIQEKKYDVEGVIMEHFGQIRIIEPVTDKRVLTGIENIASSRRCEKLGAKELCKWRFDPVFREMASDGSIIGAEVTWIHRFAYIFQYAHNLRNEMQEIDLMLRLYEAGIMPN
ncbi:MAG: hypothetical protein JWM56_978 [Candidatus Peribacteria bacterium]|nr:hypothetical protein [Candidatus Peribacteria bacterium]